MAQTKRIYVVQEASGGAQRLVKAGSRSQAVSHVVGSRFSATVAKQADIVNLMSQGYAVEEAGEDPGSEPQAPAGGNGSQPQTSAS